MENAPILIICNAEGLEVQAVAGLTLHMNADIVDLRAFYHSQLGQLTAQSIAMAIAPIWTKLPDERLVGLGYTLPYLDRFRGDAERAMAFMPASQGAINWPASGPSATTLVFDEELPLPDASIDRILLIHALEFTENPGETMRELWRILAPGGRVVIVAPNRRGVWARVDHTPFGNGRPYSKSQIIQLLRETNFTPNAFAEALFFPPSKNRALLKFYANIERCGRIFWPAFSGVNIVEAQKRLYQGLPVAARTSRRILMPALSPQGVPTTRNTRQKP